VNGGHKRIHSHCSSFLGNAGLFGNPGYEIRFRHVFLLSPIPKYRKCNKINTQSPAEFIQSISEPVKMYSGFFLEISEVDRTFMFIYSKIEVKYGIDALHSL
jgi:hypothetical protein